MCNRAFPAPNVKSLTWFGDELVDWVDGGCIYTATGEARPSYVRYAYPFDAAVVSASGEYVALYTRRGTKALLLRQGRIIRELNRSFYQANAFDYPITFVTLRDGSEAIAHCPSDYNRLEFEIAATGEILTNVATRRPADYFFSRLHSSPNGQFLSSGGWVWHPVDVPTVYDIFEVEKNAKVLDGGGFDLSLWVDESTATFLSNNELVVGWGGCELSGQSAEIEGTELRTYSLDSGVAKVVRSVRVDKRISLLSGVGGGAIFALGECPLIVDAGTGTTLESWPDLRVDSIRRSAVDPAAVNPIVAVHPDRSRFAMWEGGQIFVREFRSSKS